MLLAERDKRNSDGKYTKIFLTLGLFAVFLLVALRSEMGTDYNTYKYIFENITPIHEKRIELAPKLNFETPQIYFVSFLKAIINNTNFIFAAYAFLSIIFLYRPIINISHYPLLSCLLYFNLYTLPLLFNGISQGLVQSLFLFLLITKKKINTLVVLSISVLLSLFHSSGLLILPLYYLFNKVKINLKAYLSLLILTILFKLFSIDIILFELLLRYVFSDGFIHVLELYNAKYELPNTTIQIIYRSLLLFPMFFVFKQIQQHFVYRQMFMIYFLGFLSFILFDFLGLFMARINMVLRIFEIFLIPYTIFCLNNKLKVTTLFYYIVLTTYVLTSNFSKLAYYPYKSILNTLF